MKKKRLVAVLTAAFLTMSINTAFAKPSGIYLQSKKNPQNVLYISYIDYMKASVSRNTNLKEVLNDYEVSGITVKNKNDKKVINYKSYVKDYKGKKVKNMDHYASKNGCSTYKNPKKVKQLKKNGEIGKEITAPDIQDTSKEKDYISILEARNKGKGENVIIKGIVTGLIGNNAFIQDDTAGIYVFVNGIKNENLKHGNVVRVSGKLDEYQKMKQINGKDNQVIIEKINEDKIPEAKVVEELGEQIEGQLVTIKDLKIKSISKDKRTNGYTVIAENNKGKSISLRVDPKLDPFVENSIFIKEQKINVTSPVSRYKSQYQLMIRSIDDIQFIKEDGTEVKIDIKEFPKVSIVKGNSLPENINALMTNGSKKQFKVKWLDKIDVNTVGTKKVNIEVDGKKYEVELDIKEKSTTDGSNLPENIQKYYETAEGKVGEELKESLHDIIKGHKKISYKQVWGGIQDTDEDPNNPNNVILLYSGKSVPKSDHGGMPTQWNREHVWAKSRGQFGTKNGAGTDLHHLRAANVSVNGSRGHLDFDNGGSPVNGAFDCKKTNDTWEPRDEVKGDVARMLFYMEVRYNGDAQGEPNLKIVDKITPNNKGGQIGRLSTLLKWHKEDPVDDVERRRNNIIYEKYQGNRNPFIDHPEWVDMIWTDVLYKSRSPLFIYDSILGQDLQAIQQ